MKLSGLIPSRRLLALAALALGVAIAELFLPALESAWIAAAVVATAVAAVDAWIALETQPLTAERATPASLALGVWRSVSLRVWNRAGAARRVDVFDHHPPECEVRGMPQSLTIAARGWAQIDYEVKPVRRGDVVFGPIEMRVASPLGLWSCTVREPAGATARVYPNFSALTGYALLATDQRLSHMGVLQRQRRGEGLEFHQLREYREGDTQRQVDWKATSRAGKLISREYQDERDQNIVFLIDCGRRLSARDDELTHFDHVLNAVLLLAYVSLRQGDAAGFLTMSGPTRYMAPRKSAATVNAMLNQLYDLQPTLKTSDYYAAAVDLMLRVRKRALVVVVSNLRDEDEDTLGPALRLLGKRHLVLFASLREAILSRAMKSRVDTFDRALTYAATAEYLRARELTAARLERYGAQFLDVEPTELPLALVNRYLDIKRAGLL
ncbi:MAG TPA: DUF58 domain-containing protein [Burkholderiales bacterium]|nr:DUF58 domain-containing protein [Burkholderiales bacterium]